MATGTTTQYGLAVGGGSAGAYTPIFRDGFVNAVFKNNQFLGLTVNGSPLFPELPVGDTNYRYKLISSANTSAGTFSEGDSAPQPVAISPVNAVIAYTYFWAWVRTSGRVRDLDKTQRVSMIEQEMSGAREDIVDVMNTGFMGTSNAGLLTAISDDLTYGGISRGSAAYFESTDTNHNAALTRVGLTNVIETAEDNDKGAVTSVILTSRNQVTNYTNLAGEPNTENSSISVELGLVGGGRLDLGYNVRALSFQGIPIISIPDFSDTDWAGLDLRMTRVGPSWGLSIRRPFEMRGPQMSADDDIWELSAAAALVCHQPKTQWKLTDVTA